MRRLLLLTAAVLAAGCAGGGFDADQAAVVDGHVITVADVQSGLAFQRAQADAQVQQGALAEVPDDAALSRMALEFLIQRQFIGAGAEAEGITISEREIDEELERTREQYSSQGQSLEDTLAGVGLTEDDLRPQLELSLLAQQVSEVLVPVRTDGELRQQLADRSEDVLQVDVRHVLADEQGTAEQARAELEAGGSWDQVAQRYSTDPGSKDQGGELGTLAKGATVPEFEETVFQLAQEGECASADGPCASRISEPVQSQFGWHVIQVTAVRLPTVDELRDQETNSQELQQRRQQALAGWFTELATSTEVEVNPRFGTWDSGSGTLADRETAPQQPAPPGSEGGLLPPGGGQQP